MVTHFLQVCLFNQICSNGAELFAVREGEPFHCQFSEEGLAELQAILMAPRAPPSADAVECTRARVCAAQKAAGWDVHCSGDAAGEPTG